MNLSNATNATISDYDAQATITDDDDAPTISVNDVTVDESTGTVEFTVSLSAESGKDVSVNYGTAGDSAVDGEDFSGTSGTLTIYADSGTSETVSVSITDDSMDEFDETFFVNLSGPVNATISDAQGVATITDDDLAPTISIDDQWNSEGETAQFTVSLSEPSGKDISVDFATADGDAVAGDDYTVASGTITFTAGQAASQIVSVLLSTDGVDESDESFFVNLTSPVNASLSDGQGLGTITDIDDSPEFDSLSDPDSYTFDVAYGVPTQVGQVLAADPQGDAVTYQITAGNALGHFTLTQNPDGTATIGVAPSAPLPFDSTVPANNTHVLTIVGSDPHGNSDTALVTINVHEYIFAVDTPHDWTTSHFVSSQGSLGSASVTYQKLAPLDVAVELPSVVTSPSSYYIMFNVLGSAQVFTSDDACIAVSSPIQLSTFDYEERFYVGNSATTGNADVTVSLLMEDGSGGFVQQDEKFPVISFLKRLLRPRKLLKKVGDRAAQEAGEVDLAERAKKEIRDNVNANVAQPLVNQLNQTFANNVPVSDPDYAIKLATKDAGVASVNGIPTYVADRVVDGYLGTQNIEFDMILPDSILAKDVLTEVENEQESPTPPPPTGFQWHGFNIDYSWNNIWSNTDVQNAILNGDWSFVDDIRPETVVREIKAGFDLNLPNGTIATEWGMFLNSTKSGRMGENTWRGNITIKEGFLGLPKDVSIEGQFTPGVGAGEHGPAVPQSWDLIVPAIDWRY